MNILLFIVVVVLIIFLVRYWELRKFRKTLAKRHEEYSKEIKSLRDQLNQRIAIMDKMIKHLSFSNKELSDLNKLKSQFISIVAHDLKQPLAAIQGYAGLLKDTQSSKEDSEMINTILSAADNMNELMNDLVDASVFSTGGVKITKEEVNIPALIDNIYSQYKIVAKEKGISLVKNNCSPNIIVHADKTRITQVLSNLLANAIKFTAPSGKIEINCAIKDKELCLSVKDSGIGVPHSEHTKIFKRFHQLSKKNKSQSNGGWGLGLPIAADIIKAHGGKIWVESEGKGKGSSFKFTIPL